MGRQGQPSHSSDSCPCVFAVQRPAPADAFPRSCPAVGVHSRREREGGLGLPYPIGGNAVGVAPVPAVPFCQPSDTGPVLAGTGAGRRRLGQHPAIAPLVHQVGHRHPAPAVVTGAVGGLHLDPPGHPAADANGAGAGTLPMLSATLERALAGPVTGPVTVWSRDGVSAALNCR